MAFGEARKKKLGRPKNVPNKVTQETVRRALDTGALPSEQLLKLGRLAIGMVAKLQEYLAIGRPGEKPDEFAAKLMSKAHEEYKAWFALAIDANNKASPYFSYRLAAVKVERGVPDLAALTDDELHEVERVAELLTAG